MPVDLYIKNKVKLYILRHALQDIVNLKITNYYDKNDMHNTVKTFDLIYINLYNLHLYL